MKTALVLAIGAVLAASAPALAQNAPDPAASKVMQLGVAASGVVAKILVVNGAHVDAGDPLLQLDCRPFEREIEVRKSALAAAQAAFERTRNGSRPDEIAIGEANVGVAQARADEAGDAYARLKGLTEGVSVTRAQLLESRRDARVTAAQLEDARKRLALLQAGSRPEDIAEQTAKRDQAAAELSLGQSQLEQCTVHAPAAGVVQVLATPGQYVSTSVPAVLARLTPDAATH
jgi:multidrug resistance efflux pump